MDSSATHGLLEVDFGIEAHTVSAPTLMLVIVVNASDENPM